MKKIIKYFSLFLLLSIIYGLYSYYQRLEIITGYSSKSTASVVFLANRSVASAAEDNDFPPINWADIEVDIKQKTALATVAGLQKRIAVYRKGLGAVLINDDYDKEASYLAPKRNKSPENLPYPYGNLPQKDTVFSNVNYDKLQAVVKASFDSLNKTRSVLVLYKDQIIAEQYADGFDKKSLQLGWSMTKSVMATLYGVLEQQGKIDVDQPAPIEAWKNDERSKITINNLLQMNSGLEWEENYNTISDVTKMLFLATDMTQSQIDKPLIGKPNETWNYSSGTSNLLSGVLRNQFTTHQEYLDFWYSALIDRIGMHSMVVEADLAGNYVASSYAWATTRDWAKFGLLYLNNGDWNGDQVITKDWVDYVTTATNTSNGKYGAQFWLNASGELKDVPTTMYFADGFQGQRVFILPSKGLVVVRTGLNNMDYNTFLSGILESVE